MAKFAASPQLKPANHIPILGISSIWETLCPTSNNWCKTSIPLMYWKTPKLKCSEKSMGINSDAHWCPNIYSGCWHWDSGESILGVNLTYGCSTVLLSTLAGFIFFANFKRFRTKKFTRNDTICLLTASSLYHCIQQTEWQISKTKIGNVLILKSLDLWVAIKETAPDEVYINSLHKEILKRKIQEL